MKSWLAIISNPTRAAATAVAALLIASCADRPPTDATALGADAPTSAVRGYLRLSTIAVTPATASVPAGTAVTFTAVGKDRYGNTVAVTPAWSVVNGGGSISQAGAFTAGATAGTYANTVRAASGSIAGSATVTVTAPAAEARIGLAPASLSFSGKAGGANPASQSLTVSNSGGGTMAWTATKVLGAAWLLLTPAGGTAPSAVTVSVNVAGLAAGTYGDTIRVAAPGAGNSPSQVPVSFVVGAADTSLVPDVINNESFENGWGPFTNGGSAAPVGATIATDYAFDGTHSARYAWTAGNGGDIGANMYSVSSGSYDRWWVRVYFRLTTHITSTWKFIRFYDRSISTNLGGLWIGSDNNGGGIIGVGWDREDEAIVTPIGLTEAQVVDGKWHELEVDFQRNGGASGYPEASFWFDGKPQYAEYNGHSTVKYWGAGNNSTWVNGRINAGQRSSTAQLSVIEWMGTLNAGNQSTGQANLDRVAVSSRGLIGP